MATSDAAEKATVLVVCGDAEVVRSLSGLAGSAATLSVLSVAADAQAALSRIRAEGPGVVLIDVDLLGPEAESFIRDVQRAAPSTRVLSMSARHDRVHVTRMLSAGAVGCLAKGTGADLAGAVRAALRGELVLPYDLAVETVGKSALRAIATQTSRTEIRETIEEGSFQIAFQPVFDLRGLKVAGVEALARFDPAAERRPDVWIAEAWALGLGLDLELAILSRAIGAARRRPPGMFLSVNVSLLAAVTDRLRETLFEVDDAESLMVEIAQPLHPDDCDTLVGPLTRLRSLGTRLAVLGGDELDRGHLRRLRPDLLKMETSWVGDMEIDPWRRRRLHTVVRAADDVGCAVAAVGIETAVQLRTLRETGVRYGQGFLLARPQEQLDLSTL